MSNLISLKKCFNVPDERKTLKLPLKDGINLEEATLVAYRYVMDNDDGVSRVCFRYGTRGYIVVVRLKDEEIEKSDDQMNLVEEK